MYGKTLYLLLNFVVNLNHSKRVVFFKKLQLLGHDQQKIGIGPQKAIYMML